MRFYEQLNQYMKVVNCTAKELCTVSGISAAALSRYRSGERGSSAIIRFSSFSMSRYIV